MTAEERHEQAETFLRTAHDLRNPIAVLRATLEWLASEVAPGETADAVADAAAATQRLASIADHLEILARLESEPPLRETHALAGLVEEMTAESDGLTVTGDPRLLSRMFEVLTAHARRAARPNAPIAIVARAAGGNVEISFGSADVESGGLALYLVRRVLEVQGGALVSDGGRLVVRLPR